MRRWPKKALGDVATFTNGRAFKPSQWSLKGIPIVRIQNLTDPAAPANCFEGAIDKRHAITDGDLLVSWSATLDVFVWNRGDAVLNQHIFQVSPDTFQVSKTYLFYALKSVMDELRAKTHGATMQHITKGPFERTEIPVPHLSEQSRIVKLLDEASKLQSLRVQADHRTADLIPALFHELFGDADSNSKNLTRIKVRDAVDLINGRAFKPTDWGKDGLPIIRIQNLRNSAATFNHYNGEFEAKHRVRKGALLISWAGQLVSFGVHIWDGPEGVLNQHIFKVQPRRDFEIPFLQHALAHVVERAKSRFQGSEMKHLTRGTLDEAEILSPPMSLQKEFTRRVARYQEIKAGQADSHNRLDDLYRSMLHRAFSGEL